MGRPARKQEGAPAAGIAVVPGNGDVALGVLHSVAKAAIEICHVYTDPRDFTHRSRLVSRSFLGPPPDDILEVSTMCGHGVISFRLVEETFAGVEEGLLSIAQVVEKLDRPCTCGLVNRERVLAILEA